MRKLIYLLGGLTVLTGCEPNTESLLTRAGQDWTVNRMIYEFTRDFDVLENLDSLNVGSMGFLENGRGVWRNGTIRIKNDTIVGDSFSWSYESGEVALRFDFPQQNFGSFQNYDFKVLENKRDQQLWRTEKNFKVWNNLQQDSSDARIIWQWNLGQ